MIGGVLLAAGAILLGLDWWIVGAHPPDPHSPRDNGSWSWAGPLGYLCLLAGLAIVVAGI